MALRVAAHTFIFQQYGFDQVKQSGKIADIIAQAGFDAIEWHHTAFVGDDYKNRLEHAQRNSGLDLVGVTHSLPLWNQAEYERVTDILDEHAEKMSSIEPGLTCNLSCSGKASANRNPSQNEHFVQVWKEVCGLFDSLDLKVSYQNNGDSKANFDYLVKNFEEEESLFFCPDIQSLQTAGIDPIAFLDKNAERIASLHVRDYHLDGGRTVVIGEGDLPLKQINDTLKAIEFDGDVIVDLILPSGTPPDRPLLEILTQSRQAISDNLTL
jgi:sugar phosphate isomerase/epimerase